GRGRDHPGRDGRRHLRRHLREVVRHAAADPRRLQPVRDPGRDTGRVVTAMNVSAARRGGLSPRRRQQISRGVQYAILVIAVAVLAALADWPAIGEAFFNLSVAAEGFPDLFTVALKNTVIYTLAGFVVGFALGLVLALMRLSSVAPYRWISIVYIEVFRGLP